MMRTYQDLLSMGTNEERRKSFILEAVNEYKGTDMYHWAVEGELYAKQKNTTIHNYRKLLFTMSGKAVPDNFSANHKMASNFFSRFITQENQYLLGNGVIFQEDNTKDLLGGDSFDFQLQKAGKNALIAGVSYGFFNLDHIDVFKATEFVPLFDEEDGALKAGIRFWQVDTTKPLRTTLYELDGYTDYIKKKDGVNEVMTPKRAYRQVVLKSVADGTIIYDGNNYPGFPIVPLWGNPDRQSELVGLKEEIDAYDLIRSGFANDMDDCSQIYWILENAGGMDEVDIARFLERLRTVHAANLEDSGAKAEAHTVEVPYLGRETYLSRLEADMYNDAMALNVNQISAGNITATAIQASYEPLNNKTDQFEYCIDEFIKGLLDLVGVVDSPSFVRSKIANMTEETNMVLAAAQYLDNETILRHLPFLSPSEIDDILMKTTVEEAERFETIEESEEE